MAFFLTLVIDGALAGALYALIALAFVLVFKASAMINFALGDWVTFGALLAGAGAHALQLGGAGGLLFAMLAMAALALAFAHLVVRRLIARPAIAALMVTLGLGMVMRGVAPMVFGEAPGPIPQTLLREPLSAGGIAIPAGKLAAGGVAALCTALIGWFYRASRTGLALRAIADDPQAAASAGIDVGGHLLLVWALTGAVAVVAGVLWAFVAGSGFGVALIGLRIFPIVIIGGLDSVPGTIVAAISIGVLESLCAGYLDAIVGSGFGGLVPWLALLAMLIVRPYGLFGSPRIERV
jgi:branched-chain amino acid transport system permease protein